MKALVVMCLIFVSCFADDNPTTVHKNVEDDDGGHDTGQHKPDNLKMQSYAGGYEGFGGGFDGGVGGGFGGYGR